MQNVKKALRMLPVAALVGLASLPAHAAGSDDCVLLSAAEVRAALEAEPQATSTDPAGICGWSTASGLMLALNLTRFPTAAEAARFVDAMRNTTLAPGQRVAAAPRLGQRSVLLVSSAGLGMASTMLATQEQTDAVMLSLYGPEADSAALGNAVAGLMERVLSRRSRAEQSFGSCEWWPTAAAEKLLGAKPLRIHRMGTRGCTASVPATNAALVVTSSPSNGPAPLANMREQSRQFCTVVDLPQLGEEAHASFNCKAPADLALSIHLARGRWEVTWVLNRQSRPAGADDLKALLPIVQESLRHADSGLR